MRTLLPITVAFLLCSFNLLSQTQGVAYTAVGKGVATTFLTDYHCLGINTSALGFGTGYKDKRFTTGTTEFSLGIYSDKLDKNKLSSLYRAIEGSITGKDQDPATWDEQLAYAADYIEAGISIDASYNWLGLSFQSEKFGGIAFNIQEQYSWYSKLNTETTDIIFRGKLSDYFDELTVVYGADTTFVPNDGTLSDDSLNHVVSGTISVPLNISEITNGSNIRFAWNRHYNLGYGRKLFGDSSFAIYAGIGGRFIQSTAMFSLASDDDGLYMYSSVSPSFGIDYGAAANTNPSAYTSTGGIPAVVGNGYGLDFSVSARLFSKLKIGLAVNNIGSVTYKRNVYKVNDTLVGQIRLDGLSSYDITNSVEELLEDGGLLSLIGEEDFTINNSANIRLGASFELGRFAEVGIDLVAPFNRSLPGTLESFVFSAGAEIRPLKWLELNIGYYGGGIYAHNIPVGINFVLGKGSYEFGIASRDALSFFLKQSNSVSGAFGIARFRF